MVPVLVLLLLGPAQTIAGKYPHPPPGAAAEALPDPLPSEVAALCALLERGHDEPAVWGALGEALLADGRGRLAYRAFRKGQRRAHAEHRTDLALALQARCAACPPVPDAVIAAEEAEGAAWAGAYAEWEKDRRARGLPVDDRASFYARWGRPEDDLAAIVRATRVAFLGGVAVGAAGLVVAVGVISGRFARGAAFGALLLGGVALAAPLLLGRTGLLTGGGALAVACGAVALVAARFRSRRPARTLRP